jgi:hypothetical protein
LKVGENYKEEGIYEFIFSDTKDELPYDWEEWGWDEIPAKDMAQPPSRDFIKKVLTLKTDKFKLEVLHESLFFSIIQGFDKIISLAYERYEDTTEGEMVVDFSEFKRLVFHYGDTLKDVEEKLYVREVKLEIN